MLFWKRIHKNLDVCRKIKQNKPEKKFPFDDLWRSFQPTFLFKQGHLKPTAQDQVQKAFEYLQGGRLHNVSRQFVFVYFVISTVRKFLMFTGSLPRFGLCPFPLFLSLSTTEKNLTPSSARSSFRYSCTLTRYSLTLLFSRMNSPRCLSVSSQEKCCRPFVTLVECLGFFGISLICLCLFSTEGPRTGRDTLDVPHPCWVEGKVHLLWPAGNIPCNAACSSVCLLCHKPHCSLMFNLVSTRTPRSFSEKLFQQVSHQHIFVHGIIHSWGQDIALSFVVLLELPVT